MIKERLAELLSRKLSGEATTEELQELERWLQTHPGDQYFSDILFNYWNSHHIISPPGNISPDQHFAHILQMATEDQDVNLVVSLPKKNNKVRSIKRWIIAASIAGIIALPVWLFNQQRASFITKPAQPKNEVMAKRGARSKMILPDGTQVWLNSDSKIQYDQAFNDSLREVILDGEAYFDVVKNPKRPFIVHTSYIDIRVLGTSFNVKSYSQENTIETTLIHGSVEVTKKDESQLSKIILRPKEKLVFNKLKTDFLKEDDTPVTAGIVQNAQAIAIVALPRDIADTSLKETSWIYNRLDFEGDTFSELAIKMERWFNVKITFKNEKVANERLRGAFEDESLDEALKALQLITRFTYKMNDNEIEINN